MSILLPTDNKLLAKMLLALGAGLGYTVLAPSGGAPAGRVARSSALVMMPRSTPQVPLGHRPPSAQRNHLQPRSWRLVRLEAARVRRVYAHGPPGLSVAPLRDGARPPHRPPRRTAPPTVHRPPPTAHRPSCGGTVRPANRPPPAGSRRPPQVPYTFPWISTWHWPSSTLSRHNT
jgi:hypothetical protein